jgi:ABC-type sugar transport system ATPase subunit
MIGRELEAFKRVETTPGEEALRVHNLRREGKFADVSLTVHQGEVVGLAGLVGSGRTEILEAVFGIESATGEVYVRRQPFENRSPHRAMKLGIGLVPEDRKRQGLVLSLSARENISLAALESVAAGPWISSRRETSLVKAMFEKVRVKAPSLDAPTVDLSGGNQQKLVLAKWMAANSQILLLDEPTRGVDVGAKAEIYGIIRETVQSGGAVLLASSELPELLALSTRIIVVRDGRIAGELPAAEATEEGLMRLMTGVA